MLIIKVKSSKPPKVKSSADDSLRILASLIAHFHFKKNSEKTKAEKQAPQNGKPDNG